MKITKKNKKDTRNAIKGITLISLVVTIIILLILAGISISLIAGSEGLMSKTSGALDKNEEATATEKMELKITYFNMISYGENTRKANLQELAEGMFQDKEIDYVKIKEQKVASLEAIDVTGENSIFVKLKDYPYEFEIDSSLHLASVDGVRIANSNTTSSTTSATNDELVTKDNPIIVNGLTTNFVFLDQNVTISSISGYKYLLFTYGAADPNTGHVEGHFTKLIPVDDSIYETDSFFVLDADDGENFSTIFIGFIDDHTIKIGYAKGGNSLRTHFAITSIKGIK